jgi:hypothetical protein
MSGLHGTEAAAVGVAGGRSPIAMPHVPLLQRPVAAGPACAVVTAAPANSAILDGWVGPGTRGPEQGREGLGIYQ